MEREQVVEQEAEAPEVVEVEVERLPGPDEAAASSRPGRRVWRAVRPVLVGAVVDLVDFATWPSPVGFVFGALAGTWVAYELRLGWRARLMVALGTGAYCVMPFTRYLPVATLLGALGRLNLPDDERAS